jgi:hypothetical protein
MLYWGGPDGFSPQRRWEVIGNGPHAMNIRDVGNAYDRGLYEDYISPAHQIAEGQRPTALKWDADTPLGTAVRFAVRYAPSPDGIEKSAWNDVDKGSLNPPGDARFMQYRARVITPNGGPTPYLRSVTVTFSQ